MFVFILRRAILFSKFKSLIREFLKDSHRASTKVCFDKLYARAKFQLSRSNIRRYTNQRLIFFILRGLLFIHIRDHLDFVFYLGFDLG